MMLEEKIAMAQTIRGRDRFGPVSPEELAALPGTETELHIPVEGGRTVHVYEERPDHLPEKAALVLNFHGGGFIKGRTDRDRRYCCTIMEQLNVLVWDVDYCIAPEEPFPAAVEEAYGIAAYAFDHAEELGIDPDKIILAGHSAGGNLAAAVSLMARDRGEFQPRRQILIYPATASDHSAASPFASIRENGTGYLLTAKRVQDYMDLYIRTDSDRRDPYFAPLAARDLSRQPDTLIITAQYDPLRDEGEAYGRRLTASGNRVEMYRMPDALHGFFSLPPRFIQVRKSYAMIQHFLGGGSV